MASGALTPNEFAMLKGQQVQPPQEGEKTTSASTYDWLEIAVHVNRLRDFLCAVTLVLVS